MTCIVSDCPELDGCMFIQCGTPCKDPEHRAERDAKIGTAILIVLLVLWTAVLYVRGVKAQDQQFEMEMIYTYTQGIFKTPVYRFVDREAGTVCYAFSSYGISCIPMSATKLR